MIFKGISVGEQSPQGPTPPTKKQEDTMENRLGYHILPYRLAKISELSAKIVKLIVCNPSVNYTRNEAHIILELAAEVLDKREEEEPCS